MVKGMLQYTKECTTAPSLINAPFLANEVGIETTIDEKVRRILHDVGNMRIFVERSMFSPQIRNICISPLVLMTVQLRMSRNDLADKTDRSSTYTCMLGKRKIYSVFGRTTLAHVPPMKSGFRLPQGGKESRRAKGKI